MESAFFETKVFTYIGRECTCLSSGLKKNASKNMRHPDWFSHAASWLQGAPVGKERTEGSEDQIAAPAWPLSGCRTWTGYFPTLNLQSPSCEGRGLN